MIFMNACEKPYASFTHVMPSADLGGIRDGLGCFDFYLSPAYDPQVDIEGNRMCWVDAIGERYNLPEELLIDGLKTA